MDRLQRAEQENLLIESIEAELHGLLDDKLAEAEAKAWDSLARYKFQMFGYWSSIWVHLNRIGKFNHPNPWKEVVDCAKAREAARAVARLRNSKGGRHGK